MIELIKACLALKTDKRAVTALEYSLIAGLVAVVIIAGVSFLGGSLNDKFSALGSQVAAAGTSSAAAQ